MSLRKSHRFRIVLSILISTAITSLFASVVFHWSGLNCWHDDIDINSGRVRHTRFILYCQIGDRTEETWLSRACDGSFQSPDWRRVNTFSPLVHYSPHYRYHGAIDQIELLQLCDERIPFESDARRKVGLGILALWQNTSSYHDADQYVHAIETVVSKLHRDGASIITASDLPDG